MNRRRIAPGSISHFESPPESAIKKEFAVMIKIDGLLSPIGITEALKQGLRWRKDARTVNDEELGKQQRLAGCRQGIERSAERVRVRKRGGKVKPNEKLMLSEAWWKAGKPGILTDTALSNALRAFDTADHQFQAQKILQRYDAVVKALDAVNTARLATIQKCGGNLLLKDVKAALSNDGVIRQRKEIVKAAMTEVIEASVHKLEKSLNIETERVNRCERTANEIAEKIEADQKAGKSLEQHGKALGDIWSNLTVLYPVSISANEVMVELSRVSVNGHFPQHVARLKAIKLPSVENDKNKKRVQDVISENRSIVVENLPDKIRHPYARVTV